MGNKVWENIMKKQAARRTKAEICAKAMAEAADTGNIILTVPLSEK